MKPLVSIIIPVFNRENLITQTLNSVLEQTYVNWECIIVDDGSNDKSEIIISEYLKKDKRFFFFKRPIDKLKGANACRNFGKLNSNGDFIIFLDSDDLLVNTCLENRIDYFKNNPHYDLVIFSMGHFIDDKTNCYLDINRTLVNLNNEETIREFVLGGKLPWNVTRPIFKSSMIVSINFNETIHNFQDDEFNIRVLSKVQPKYISVDITDCYYRMDLVSIKKYENFAGYQNILNSLNVYYQTVFMAFSENLKIQERNTLIRKLFKQLDSYILPKMDLSLIKETILLFKKELKLTLLERFILFLIIKLKIYYFNRKGYYSIRKILYTFLKK